MATDAIQDLPLRDFFDGQDLVKTRKRSALALGDLQVLLARGCVVLRGAGLRDVRRPVAAEVGKRGAEDVAPDARRRQPGQAHRARRQRKQRLAVFEPRDDACAMLRLGLRDAPGAAVGLRLQRRHRRVARDPARAGERGEARAVQELQALGVLRRSVDAQHDGLDFLEPPHRAEVGARAVRIAGDAAHHPVAHPALDRGLQLGEPAVRGVADACGGEHGRRPRAARGMLRPRRGKRPGDEEHDAGVEELVALVRDAGRDGAHREVHPREVDERVGGRGLALLELPQVAEQRAERQAPGAREALREQDRHQHRRQPEQRRQHRARGARLLERGEEPHQQPDEEDRARIGDARKVDVAQLDARMAPVRRFGEERRAPPRRRVARRQPQKASAAPSSSGGTLIAASPARLRSGRARTTSRSLPFAT